MEKSEIVQIILSLGITQKPLSIEPFVGEEDDKNYQVWRILLPEGTFVLKAAKRYETEIYHGFFRNAYSFVPQILSSGQVNGTDYLLMEYISGENLMYCTEHANEASMIHACKAVGLHHFIRTLPKGYDTVLNDQVSLSQGQKQQITIARAMIADRPMLILDEATSSVDTRTELQIQNAMDQLMKGRTSFVIAHRLSTIKNADLILVLKDGDIIESGNHEELLAANGFYAELYNSQFEQSA